MTDKQKYNIDRAAAVAGSFYASEPDKLVREIEFLFQKAKKLISTNISEEDELRALISPHAGYVFSGTVAASAYLSINKKKNYERVFLIGSSHHSSFHGASVYARGNYLTPLGVAKVDKEISQELLDNNKVFQFIPEVHIPEHTIEVQLPFLQYLFEDKLKIVPIVVGTMSKDSCFEISECLKKYFIPDNLFIISTDLSHYPEYNDAIKTDKKTINALCKNDPQEFLKQLKENELKKTKNLSTSMCGWTSVLILLYLTAGNEDIEYLPILYQNSGEIPVYGEKSRVVGYQSIAIVSKKKTDNNIPFHFSKEEQAALLHITRQSIYNHLYKFKSNVLQSLLPTLSVNCGAFVSVYINNKLRGCIGNIFSNNPLYKTLQNLAVNSAFFDDRFEPITKEELEKLKIEISVLSPLKEISHISEIIPGKHGIYIKKGSFSGTYLPQVAVKTGWNTEELLSHCSEEKVGIGKNGWKDAQIFTYEAFIISG
jgi:AmmeMemoRadiSam system protein B/AmmeMemoRadiSam system protein A